MFGNPLVASFVVLVATLAVAATVEAQEGATAEALRQRLAELDRQVDERTQALESMRHANEQRIRAMESQRKQVATRLLDEDRRRIRLKRESQDLDDRHSRLLSATAELRNELRSAVHAARSGIEKLQIHLDEVPGRTQDAERVAHLIATLSIEQDADVRDSHVEAYIAALAVANQTLDDATRLTVREANVWTARDESETVRLLSVGHVAFAYETVANGRLGIALASAADATGYRWTENLTSAVKSDLREAFERVAAGEPSVVDVPMDVTGRIQPSALAAHHDDLLTRFREGGLVMFPLAVVAALSLVLIAERCWMLYMRNSDAESLARGVIDAALDGRVDEAERLCGRRGGAVARTLAACLRRSGKGPVAMEDSVQAQLLNELPRLQRFMGGIAILAAVAPLLGLLGTVTGIIQTFGIIRAYGNANPSLMAGGISEALTTTAAGLVIAVPILLIHSVLSGRVDRIVGNAEKHAANLLAVLAHDHTPTDADRDDATVRLDEAPEGAPAHA